MSTGKTLVGDRFKARIGDRIALNALVERQNILSAEIQKIENSIAALGDSVCDDNKIPRKTGLDLQGEEWVVTKLAPEPEPSTEKAPAAPTPAP